MFHVNRKCQEMRSKFVTGHVQVQQEVPNEEPGHQLTLGGYERKIKDCESCFQIVENCHLKNAFAYGKVIEPILRKVPKGGRHLHESYLSYSLQHTKKVSYFT